VTQTPSAALPMPETATISVAIREQLTEYADVGAPVRLTLHNGRTLAGPVVRVHADAVVLDPELETEIKITPGRDWVDRYTLINLAAVAVVTYA
jgi:primosomal protein N'